MNKLRDIMKSKSGFTIIEILIVLSIIGILATITVVGYGAWRHSVLAAAVKSDLNGVAAAMESERTFSNAYPLMAIPSSITPSENVAFNGGGSVDGLTYCVDGISTEDATITYYVASEVKDQGAQEGTCAGRSSLPLPDIPGNLAITSSIGTQVGLSWSNNDPLDEVINYTAQCASDAGYIFGMQQATVTGTTVTITDLTPSTTFYCRVKATNNSGSSDWSASVSSSTSSNYGSLAVATSIEGYWNAPPQGFLFEDGSAISRTIYSNLFEVIGTTYGAGDGSTTFNVPDSRGRVAVNKSSDSEFDTMGEKPGSKTETLTITQIPSHTHIQTQHNHIEGFAGVDANGGYGVATVGGGNITKQGGVSAANHAIFGPITAVNQSTGGDESHNNIQPSIVKTSAIKYAPVESNAATLPTATSIKGYWTSAPTGYLLEDGSVISRTTYAALFAVIGTTYGAGAGPTTFNLPDSRGRVAVNKSSDNEFDAMGEKYGNKTETLTITQTPSHIHTQDAHNHIDGFAGVNTVATYGVATVGVGNVNSQGGTSGANHPYTSWTTAVNQNTGGDGSHNEIQPSIVKLSAIKYTSTDGVAHPPVVATSTEGYWTSAPTGYLLEDGSAVSRTTYTELFAIIGTTHGIGDGSTTFNLPDSRGRASVNRSPFDTEFDTMGEKPGSKTETLAIVQMPSHTHIQNAHNHISGFAGYNSTATYSVTTGASGNYNNQNGTSTTNHAYASSTIGVNQSTGGDGAHNNIQPSIVKMFAIKY